MSELHRILYVEDEPDIQEIARLALETVGGLEVRICGSGQEALEVAEEYDPDLILLDVMMPGMDGPTTLAALREIPSLANKPMVFMTAKVQPHEVRHYHEIGAMEVIAKPFNPMTLAAQVRAVWDSTQTG
jgi:two-component system, OmpR family, response regulator